MAVIDVKSRKYVTSAALLLAALGCLLLQAGAAQAAFPGGNGKIAFTELDSTYNPDLATVAPDGSGRQTLLDAGSEPAWSPNGTKLAFARSSDIFIANADGTGITEVVGDAPDDDAAHDPTWSPDGSRIAYGKTGVICAPHTCVEVPNGIWVINLDGSGETQIATGTRRDPAWSPDGAKIAFDTGSMYTFGELFVMNPDGSEKVNLTNTMPYAVEEQATWSPDGSQIAFTSNDGLNARDISVMNRDGTGRTTITTDPAADSMPAWSPDGSKIVFRAARDGGGLWTTNPDGTGAARLTSEFFDFRPDWQPLVGPRRSDFKNASHFCKAERDHLGDAAFREKYGGGANAHGKCVSN